MIEIYTPKAWNAFFGGTASLYIDEEGYIYTREEHVKLMGRPGGKIDYARGEIYGNDYGGVHPRPIGYIRSDAEGVQMIYDEYPGYHVKPILYMKNGEIYTHDEYYRITGGTPIGYVKPDERGSRSQKNDQIGGQDTPDDRWTPPERRPKEDEKKSSGFSDAIGCLPEPVLAFLVIIAFALLVGFVDAIRKPVVYIPVGLGVAGGLIGAYFIRKKKKGGSSTAPRRSRPHKTHGRSAPAAKPMAKAQGNAKYCERCGKVFYTSEPGVRLCAACQKTAAQAAPQTYTYYCERCGKKVTAQGTGPRKYLCADCERQMYNTANPAQPAREVPKAQQQPAQDVPKRPQQPATALPDDMSRIFRTKAGTPTAAELKQRLNPFAHSFAPASYSSVDGVATPVQTVDGKAVFLCPHCKTRLAIPVGAGLVVIKCVTCGKQLSAKS